MALFDSLRARRAARAVERHERTTHTREQVGDAAVPQAHTATAIPGVIDVPGDELPDLVSDAHASSRKWRGVETPGRAQGTPATSTGGGGVLVNDHAQVGVPNPRAVWNTDTPAGEHAGPIGADAELRRPQTETLGNFRVEVDRDPQQAPMPPRAGSTGDDPARPAQLVGWTFLRAFDKWAAENLAPPGLDKVAYRSPLASRPIDYTNAVPGMLPSPGGGQATEPVGRVGPQPNSVRLLPRAWDELLVNNGTGQAAAVQTSEQTRRATGWRLS